MIKPANGTGTEGYELWKVSQPDIAVNRCSAEAYSCDHFGNLPSPASSCGVQGDEPSGYRLVRSDRAQHAPADVRYNQGARAALHPELSAP